MMKRFRFLICLVFAALVLALSTSALAEGGREDRKLFNYLSSLDTSGAPSIMAEGAYVIELNSGAVLYRKNSNEQFYPASITKILTALITIEHCPDLDEMVTFSKNAIHNLEEGGYSYVAEVGDQLSVRDCLYALMLMSSNECAVALAEHVAGTTNDFAVLMNEKAEEVGCTNSHFANPHGLTNASHLTTPHDMARIMWAAVQNPTFREIDGTVTYRTAPTTSNPDGYFCTMRHMMMRNTDYYDERVKGGKTGYISAAKNTLVTYAVDGDMELIIVVMRTEGTEQACKDTRSLMNYAFKNFEARPIELTIEAAKVEEQVTAKYGRVMQNFSFNSTITAVLTKESSVFFGKEVVLDEDVNGEITNGMVNTATGQILYNLDGVELGSIPLEVILAPVPTTEAETETEASTPIVTQESVEKQSSILIPVLIIIAAVLVVIIIAYIIIVNRNRRRARLRGKSRRRIESEE